MAICRICGKKFKIGTKSANEICSNDECWVKAWNGAVAPLRRTKCKSAPVCKNLHAELCEEEQE